jgi:hypothetical protein
MKTFVVLLFGIQLGLIPNTFDLHLSGHVYFENSENQNKVDGLYFFARGQNSDVIIGSDYVDADGRYEFSIYEELIRDGVRFYYAGNGFDTTFVKSMSQFESDVSIVDFTLK